MYRHLQPLTWFLIIALALLGSPNSGLAQEESTGRLTDDRVRVGVMLGGTGFLGLTAEYQRGDWSGEIILGTISFHEISVALTGKRYLSSGNLRPAIGVGIWSLTAWTEDERGSILALRVPIAADWRVSGGHHLGLEVGLNKALAIRRLDPEDDTPPGNRVIPFPGFYYRHGWSP